MLVTHDESLIEYPDRVQNIRYSLPSSFYFSAQTLTTTKSPDSQAALLAPCPHAALGSFTNPKSVNPPTD